MEKTAPHGPSFVVMYLKQTKKNVQVVWKGIVSKDYVEAYTFIKIFTGSDHMKDFCIDDAVLKKFESVAIKRYLYGKIA